ncbi:hypothetical protein E2C01_081279 [Portunus trituberculatus]|uniref:Uncharacterized protein n=1 Tax=Portunus trituberculatus TaxID=210409 RepID=A0A5B7IPB7_PORTR|nr:hypothetical protein [Portunus trituberculatus]
MMCTAFTCRPPTPFSTPHPHITHRPSLRIPHLSTHPPKLIFLVPYPLNSVPSPSPTQRNPSPISFQPTSLLVRRHTRYPTSPSHQTDGHTYTPRAESRRRGVCVAAEADMCSFRQVAPLPRQRLCAPTPARLPTTSSSSSSSPSTIPSSSSLPPSFQCSFSRSLSSFSSSVLSFSHHACSYTQFSTVHGFNGACVVYLSSVTKVVSESPSWCVRVPIQPYLQHHNSHSVCYSTYITCTDTALACFFTSNTMASSSSFPFFLFPQIPETPSCSTSSISSTTSCCFTIPTYTSSGLCVNTGGSSHDVIAGAAADWFTPGQAWELVGGVDYLRQDGENKRI